MNILRQIEEILEMPNTFVWTFPDDPDEIIGITEQEGMPPKHAFAETHYTHTIQVRVRNTNPDLAFERAEEIQEKLNHFENELFSIRQTTNILLDRQDTQDPPRFEFKVQFWFVSMK